MLKIIENLTFNYLQINKTKNVIPQNIYLVLFILKAYLRKSFQKKKSTKIAVLKNSTSFEL